MTTVKVLEEGNLLRLEIDDFAAFRSALGEETLSAFCRSFVHSDRLTSLAHFTWLLQEHCDHQSVATTRDLYSMAWFAVGTLREYGQAIQKLRAALRKADALDRDSPEWKSLMEVEGRWESDRFYVDLRDKVAFHVDPDVVSRGLEVLATKSDVALFFSDKPGSPTFAHGYWYRLGMEAVFEGYGIQRTDFENLLMRVADDMKTVNKSLYDLFTKTLQLKGISIR